MERHRRERDKLPLGYQHARRDIQDTLNDLAGDDDDGDIVFKMRRLTRSVIDAVYEAVGKAGVAPVFDVVGTYGEVADVHAPDEIDNNALRDLASVLHGAIRKQPVREFMNQLHAAS